MTKLISGRKLIRETASTDRGRAILVELLPHYCCIKVKGKRDCYSVPWDAVLDLARKLEARDRLRA